jgi:diacyltrehalose acyltransferase
MFAAGSGRRAAGEIDMNFTAKRRRVAPPSSRGELVAAARQAFDELGPGADLTDIAAVAGVDLAALTEHFPDRDAVLVAVIDELTDGLREPEPATGPALSARQVLPPVVAAAAVLSLAPASLGAAPQASAVNESVPQSAPSPVPSRVLTVSPLWPVWSLDTTLEGSMCRASPCSTVPYIPFVTPDGVRALDHQLSQSAAARAAGGGPTVVLGFSNGAGVAEQWIREHAGDPDAPSPEDLSFVLIGNPRRAHGGWLPPLPDTAYQVIDVVRQYDPMADRPDRFNLLAFANVAAGMLSPMHLDYRGVDVDDPANVRWTEGNTTYVFVPTPDLPLLRPLRAFGMDELADELDAPLRKIIESAYDRPYLTPPEPDPEPEPVTADTVKTRTAATEDTSADDDPPTPRRPAWKRAAAQRNSTVDASDTSDASGATDAKPGRHSKLGTRWGHRAGTGSTTEAEAGTGAPGGAADQAGGRHRRE